MLDTFHEFFNVGTNINRECTPQIVFRIETISALRFNDGLKQKTQLRIGTWLGMVVKRCQLSSIKWVCLCARKIQITSCIPTFYNTFFGDLSLLFCR